MKREELLIELRRIVREYTAHEVGSALAEQVNKDNVRYILMELEKMKQKPIKERDDAILAEISFNFA